MKKLVKSAHSGVFFELTKKLQYILNSLQQFPEGRLLHVGMAGAIDDKQTINFAESLIYFFQYVFITETVTSLGDFIGCRPNVLI